MTEPLCGRPSHNIKLLDALAGLEVELAHHLEALCAAQLSGASCTLRAQLGLGAARWCAERRRPELAGYRVRGDLPLAAALSTRSSDSGSDSSERGTEDESSKDDIGNKDAACSDSLALRWTWERLHLAERPPRFPRLTFEFASDVLEKGLAARVKVVVAVLRRFPGLRLRIEGHGQPSAPPSIGRPLSQARATAIRRMVLRQLHRDPGPRTRGNPWLTEDPDEGVSPAGGFDMGRGSREFYTPRVVGARLQAIGLWGRRVELRNDNFDLADTNDHDESRFQCADFTVIDFLD